MLAELPTVRDIVAGELAVVGGWVVANVSGPIYWTTRVQKVLFRGVDVFILPATREGTYPALAAREADGLARVDLRRILSGFLSSLCWTLESGALIETWTGGSRPSPLGGYNGRGGRTVEFELEDLPDPTDAKSRLALALCREAAALNLATYATITYFRVLEIHFQGHSRTIKDWINSQVPTLSDFRCSEDLSRLQAAHDSIGHYLYDSCRSAAAHGKVGTHVVVDPDDPEDEWRLKGELTVVRALAVRLTEQILGVQTRSTIYREHLYELSGFRERFGRDTVNAFKSGIRPAIGQEFDIPTLNVGLSGHRAFPSLCGLEPAHLGPASHGLVAIYSSSNRLLNIRLGIDFAEERLRFDIVQDLSLRDDGSVEAAEMAADVVEFQKHYWMNGRLRLNDADTGDLIGRKDAFLPRNVIVRSEGFDLTIAGWRSEADRRRKAWGRGWHFAWTPSRQ